MYPIRTDGFPAWLNYHFYLSAGMHNNVTNRSGFLSSALDIVQTQSSSCYNFLLSLSTWSRLQYLDCLNVWFWHCRYGGHPCRGNVDSRAWPCRFHHLWGSTLPMHCLDLFLCSPVLFPWNTHFLNHGHSSSGPDWIYNTIVLVVCSNNVSIKTRQFREGKGLCKYLRTRT